MNEAVTFHDGEIELKVSIKKEGELEKYSVVANFATTASDGKVYQTEYYNLDVIISVGYRVKSQRGVKFRQWATQILKQYIYNGYAINAQKITVDRFINLENEVVVLREKVSKIDVLINLEHLKPTQGVFYDGEIYDAYVFLNDILKDAQSKVVIIDTYIDDTTLTFITNIFRPKSHSIPWLS